MLQVRQQKISVRGIQTKLQIEYDKIIHQDLVLQFGAFIFVALSQGHFPTASAIIMIWYDRR